MKTKIYRAVIVLMCAFSIFASWKISKQQKELKAARKELENYTADELEINSCPFCESDDIELVEGSNYYVWCPNCGACGPKYGTDFNSLTDNTKTEAINQWNHIVIRQGE